MTSSKFEPVRKGIVKRTERRVLGLFIDGTGLDRATRRINRKVDMSALVRGVSAGLLPTVARYYTLIPYEDDSRQRAFLDAVSRAGLTVIVKRLPPKGITRQVSVDVEMAADIIAFSLGHSNFSSLCQYRPDAPEHEAFPPIHDNPASGGIRRIGLFPATSSQLKANKAGAPQSGPPEPPSTINNAPEALAQVPTSEAESGPTPTSSTTAVHRIVTIVCAGRDLSYPLSLSKELGADTVNADFGQFNTGDVLKSAAKWIDLSDSETIWRD